MIDSSVSDERVVLVAFVRACHPYNTEGIVAENVQALAEEERKYSRQGGHRMLSLGQSNISSSSHQQQEEKEEETE